MNNRFTKTIHVCQLAVSSLFLTVQPVLSATAAEQSCKFVDSIQFGKTEAISSAQEIMRLSGDSGLETIAEAITALSDKIDRGEVFEFANAGDLYVEHLVILGSSDRGTFYFRIVYERYANDMFGVKFVYDTDVSVVLNKWPIFQQPTPVQC